MPNDDYLTFSQRNGLSEIPEKLKIGEVSETLRKRIYYAFCKEFERCSDDSYVGICSHEKWIKILSDYMVFLLDIGPEKIT